MTREYEELYQLGLSLKDKLSVLADWLDMEQAKGRWRNTTNTEVQDDLRKFVALVNDMQTRKGRT